MYSGEYDACDVTLREYPHRAGLKNMHGHGAWERLMLAKTLKLKTLKLMEVCTVNCNQLIAENQAIHEMFESIISADGDDIAELAFLTMTNTRHFWVASNSR